MAFVPVLPLSPGNICSSAKCKSISMHRRRISHAPISCNDAQPTSLRTLLSASARSNEQQSTEWQDQVPDKVSVILLAGGKGKRMKADIPKQLLPLQGKSVVEHSICLFGQMPQVSQLVIVLSSEFRPEVQPLTENLPCAVTFAEPGEERQDSVYNGLAHIPSSASLACIHDAARPLVTKEEILKVLSDAAVHGAAVLGVPSKATIKESADGAFVLRTIPRQRLWEIHTPQVIKPDLLREGFEKVQREKLAVTDDVSIIEHLGKPVKITEGFYTNIKLTTPEDMTIAESILTDRNHVSASVP